MIRWLVERYASRYGYRKVPSRDVWAIYCDRDAEGLTPLGHANRSRAFIARKIANDANDMLDRYDNFEVFR